MIDAGQIEAIAEDLDRVLGERGGPEVAEWFAVRQVDERAVIRTAARYATAAAVASYDEGIEGALLSVFLIGFRIGLEAERGRRDREELPT